jgi:hypothetical protein
MVDLMPSDVPKLDETFKHFGISNIYSVHYTIYFNKKKIGKIDDMSYHYNEAIGPYVRI